MRPPVSILIPCFNAERWIAQAIESALAQTWENKEIIVVDDGSNDGSRDVISQFNGLIRWETGPNRGGGAARNRLLELSQGQWLQYLDADDYLLPEKVSKQAEFVSTRNDVDVVFGPATLEHWSEQNSSRELLVIPEPHDPWVLLASWRLPQTGAPLFRKSAIVDVGGWKPDQPCCQEHELYLRLLMAEKHFVFHPTNGAIYRQWSTDTVCKRDIPEVHRRRLEIEHRLESHLRNRGLLTNERLGAINQVRFQIARIAWEYEPKFAKEIIDNVLEIQPDFAPMGPAAPAHYRLVFRFFGFQAAERLAAHFRRPN